MWSAAAVSFRDQMFHRIDYTPKRTASRHDERFMGTGLPAFDLHSLGGYGFGVPWLIYAGLLLGVMYLLWKNRAGGAAPGLFSFGRSRGRVVEAAAAPGTTFADVAGVEEAKDELKEIISFLKHPDRYHRIGARIPRGVLLVGPPGTGKTLLARAVAGEAQVPFISISGSEFVEMLVGVGAARVRDLFAQATQRAPCIVFIDELDALGRSRGGVMGGSHEEREQTLNQLLVEMDGFNSHEAVIVMAATNRPEVLDPALMRPGRFDRQVVVDVPDREGRAAILKVHVRKVRLADDVDLDDIAAKTPGFAGADLANLVNEAALLSVRDGFEEVHAKAFSQAVDRVVAGLEKKSRRLDDESRKRVAYHEVGHALAGHLSGNGQRVHKISIVPRGMGALGFTMQIPDQDVPLRTEKELRATLVTLMGGRAAEEMVLGSASTGAQDDLKRATELARSMVVDFGMSEKVGPISVHTAQSPFLKNQQEPMLLTRTVGQALADQIDQEVRHITLEALREAKALLSNHEGALHRMAEALLEQEVLEGDALMALLPDAGAVK